MNKTKIISALMCAICCMAIHSSYGNADANKSTFAEVTGKKLLEYTWGPPRPEFIMEHPESLEKWPFDGTIMRPFFGSGQVFDVKSFVTHRELISAQFDKYAPIQSSKLTDNFLAMYAQSSMDWFNDEDWENIRQYVTLIAKGAKTLGCKGVVFDPEPYGFNPWNYERQIHANSKTREEYAAKARQRGKEFMDAINAGFPGAKVLFFVTPYAGFYEISHHPDMQVRERAFQNDKGHFAQTYPLYLPFYSGILDASTPENRLINTTESAYGNTSAEDFYRQYWEIDQGAQILVPTELREKYAALNRVGSNVYVDGVMGAGNFPQAAISRELSEEDRLKWLEYNIYQALKTSDEYVWLYGEQVTWWRETNDRTLNAMRPQMVEAIVSARQKVADGAAIEYEIKDAVEAAQRKAQERENSLAAEIKPHVVTISKIQNAPILEGKIDDAIYQQIPWQTAFVNFAKSGGKPAVVTQVWAAFDDKNLYIAFRNAESDMAKQRAANSDIWLGETVEVSLLKPGELPRSPHSAYYHLMLNPQNNTYNKVEQGTAETVPAWQSAVSSDERGWYAEIALPWQEFGFSDISKGMSIAINFARHRAGAQEEYTSWSPYLERFQEPENLGKLVLAE